MLEAIVTMVKQPGFLIFAPLCVVTVFALFYTVPIIVFLWGDDMLAWFWGHRYVRAAIEFENEAFLWCVDKVLVAFGAERIK